MMRRVMISLSVGPVGVTTVGVGVGVGVGGGGGGGVGGVQSNTRGVPAPLA